MSFHVLIAGGGIGGLCLAQGLRKAGVSCAVYESAPALGRAGYRLHMNGGGGAALKECLPDHLFELYMQTSRKTPRRECLVILDDQCRELGVRPHIGPPNDPDRPHTAANRRTLRQIMMHGIEDIVHFDREAVGYDPTDTGVRLRFATGDVAEGTVLVGADGIRSAIRSQLLPEVEVLDLHMPGCYSMAPLDDGDIARIGETAPELLDGFVVAAGADGTTFALGLFDPRQPVAEATAELAPGADIDDIQPYMMVNFGATPGTPYAEQIPDLSNLSTDDLHRVMREAATGWAPVIRDLVESVNPDSIFPVAIRYLEPADPWEPSRVTLLGDAIHAMPPTFGAGANSALHDARQLCRVLVRAVRGETDLTEAIAGYEAEMRADIFPILRASADPRALDTDFQPDDVESVR